MRMRQAAGGLEAVQADEEGLVAVVAALSRVFYTK
jgi:hypothetical protein